MSRETGESMPDSMLRGCVIVVLAGLAALALHALDAKTGPNEFYSSWTSWRMNSNPLLVLAGGVGLVAAFFASVMVSGSADFKKGGVTVGNLCRLSCFPLTLVTIFTLSNSPSWFQTACAVTAIIAAVVLYLYPRPAGRDARDRA